VSLFTRNTQREVHGFVLKLVNNNCPELKALIEGPRQDSRAPLTVVVLVVPLENGRPRVEQAFFAVTKEFSCNGVGLVLDHPRALEEAILGFRWQGGLVYLRASARHLNPMGGGFHQLGLQLDEVVSPADYPELESLNF